MEKIKKWKSLQENIIPVPVAGLEVEEVEVGVGVVIEVIQDKEGENIVNLPKNLIVIQNLQ